MYTVIYNTFYIRNDYMDIIRLEQAAGSQSGAHCAATQRPNGTATLSGTLEATIGNAVSSGVVSPLSTGYQNQSTGRHATNAGAKATAIVLCSAVGLGLALFLFRRSRRRVESVVLLFGLLIRRGENARKLSEPNDHDVSPYTERDTRKPLCVFCFKVHADHI